MNHSPFQDWCHGSSHGPVCSAKCCAMISMKITAPQKHSSRNVLKPGLIWRITEQWIKCFHLFAMMATYREDLLCTNSFARRMCFLCATYILDKQHLSRLCGFWIALAHKGFVFSSFRSGLRRTDSSTHKCKTEEVRKTL